MYTKFNYNIYRTVNKYYSSSIDNSGEDAYGKLFLIKIWENHYQEMWMGLHQSLQIKEFNQTIYNGIDNDYIFVVYS